MKPKQTTSFKPKSVKKAVTQTPWKVLEDKPLNQSDPKSFDLETLVTLLNNYLIEIIEREEQIELRKVKLAEWEDFNIFEVFKLCFDMKGTGLVDWQCLENAFDKLEVDFLSSENVQLVLNRYTESRKEMTYSEFCSMMLSNDKKYYELVVNRMPISTAWVTKDEFLNGGSVLENLWS